MHTAKEEYMSEVTNKKAILFLSVFARMGATLAAILSWSVNHSLAWMMLHFLVGWFYVVYYVFAK